jgi:hypothetical protein
MSRQTWICALTSILIGVVLLAIGAATMLFWPGLATEAQLLLPVFVLVSLLVGPFAGERLALRLTPGEPAHRDDGVSSGRTYPRGG